MHYRPLLHARQPTCDRPYRPTIRSIAINLSLLLMLIGLCSPAVFGAGSDTIVIKAQASEPSRIAVPSFDPGSSPVVLKNSLFRDVIYGDLELTGFFERGANQEFIEQTRRSDRTKNAVDFTEWVRLDILYLVVGKYEIQGDRLLVDVYLYYVPTGKRIFGKRFTNTVQEQRQVAHRIADEILFSVHGFKGTGNTRIMYVSTTDPTRRVREIWVMDADGANARQVTQDKSLAATPCWGIKGTEIYYTSYKAFNPDLCGAYVDGSNSWFITQFTGLNVSPAWSPRRQRIAVTLGKDGNSEIYTMGRDGKKLKRLTYDRSIDSSPCWSPDGNEIAFTSDRMGVGNPQIYVMDVDGMNARRVSYVESTYCDGAAWSPEGDKIAFAAKVNHKFHIFVCEIDGSNAEQLTFGSHNNEDPTWSPNGLMLAFTSDRTGKSQVWCINSDGSSEPHQLTREGYNTSPAWSRYPGE